MRKILFAAAGLVLAGASLTPSAPAQADANAPWCAQPRDNGYSRICDFYTFQQCQAYVSGIGGVCSENFTTHFSQPRYFAPERRARNEHRQRVRYYYAD